MPGIASNSTYSYLDVWYPFYNKDDHKEPSDGERGPENTFNDAQML